MPRQYESAGCRSIEHYSVHDWDCFTDAGEHVG